MRFIGIDISITCTGYAVFNLDGELDFYGGITTPSGQKDAFRFNTIVKRLFEQIEFNYYDYVLIENYAYKAVGQITRIAELTGIIKHYLSITLDSEKVFLCAPPTLKKFTTGKGNVQKNMMLKMAYQKWGFDSNNDNEVDAFCLGKLCHAFIVGNPTIKYEKEAIVSVAKTNEVNLNEIRQRGIETKKASVREKRSKGDSSNTNKETPKEDTKPNTAKTKGRGTTSGEVKTPRKIKRTPKEDKTLPREEPTEVEIKSRWGSVRGRK